VTNRGSGQTRPVATRCATRHVSRRRGRVLEPGPGVAFYQYGMKSILGSQACLKCGERFPPRECRGIPDRGILVGELELLDTDRRKPAWHHFKFHRECYESFNDHAERQRFMKRATDVGLFKG